MNHNGTQKYKLPDGKLYTFNHPRFLEAANKKITDLQTEGNMSTQKARIDFADKLGYSDETFRKWLAGKSAPANLDRVSDLAEYLDLEMNELLLSLEEENMKSTTKNNHAVNINEYTAIRNLYHEAVSFIESFRAADRGQYSHEKLPSLFSSFYTSLMKAKIDIPSAVFHELLDFSVNYLQLLGSYLSFEQLITDEEIPEPTDDKEYSAAFDPDDCFSICSPWLATLSVSLYPSSQYLDLYIETAKNHHLLNKLMEDGAWLFGTELLIETAYKNLFNLLSDYFES